VHDIGRFKRIVEICSGISRGKYTFIQSLEIAIMRAKVTGAQVLCPPYLIVNSNKIFMHGLYGIPQKEEDIY
jgi:hypothetical protein